MAVIVTTHPGIDYAQVAAGVPLVVDLRGVTRHSKVGNVIKL